ncbi:MAG: lipopolysaccharide biosynthesis protein RfbH [Clostridiaceae bacterium]|nr:lipopolysaccharide biosynthesis protein RfbH [Clostridiaceae bacterium]
MVTREQILNMVEQYYHEQNEEAHVFQPGERVNYGGRFYDASEMRALVDASLDFWLTNGRYVAQFETSLARFLGVKHCLTVNSGSSANLLAFMTLTSARLGARQIRPGDEVITVAAAFPTTVAPIIQYGAIPVFIDIGLPSYNINPDLLEQAFSTKTKAVMVAHTLGNPFNIEAVTKFCARHQLWLIEDNCDALGSQYSLDGRIRYTGTFGDIGTSSFYPPHHITMGEGGAVYTENDELHRIALSLRDWGRDCWCPSGKDNTCRHRFDRQYGELPLGYDHKYVYSHFGYNLKITEMQAAIGCEQLKKLPRIIKARQENWAFLRSGLAGHKDDLILPEPEQNAIPSWFGFLMTVRDTAGFTRDELVQWLEKHNVQTRMLFAGNLTKHPCFDQLKAERRGFRIVGSLERTDEVMASAFWIGVYPGMDDEKLAYMAKLIDQFITERKGMKT